MDFPFGYPLSLLDNTTNDGLSIDKIEHIISRISLIVHSIMAKYITIDIIGLSKTIKLKSTYYL
jgi:hypothetical protein